MSSVVCGEGLPLLNVFWVCVEVGIRGYLVAWDVTNLQRIVVWGGVFNCWGNYFYRWGERFAAAFGVGRGDQLSNRRSCFYWCPGRSYFL
jgi:hypothetical protein